MQSKILNSLILAALAIPGLAMAEDSPFGTNFSLVSDYLFRGVSQTGTKPALQGGFDYAHESGFYAGAWGSNISWLSDFGAATSASFELDTYLGFGGSISEDVSYDLGVLRYNYPGEYGGGTKANTNEVYASIGWKWLTAKYSYSLGDTFGSVDAKGSNYMEVSASYELPDTGVVLGAHYGKQTYKGPVSGGVTSLTDPSYSDYNVSVAKDFSGYEVGVTYSNTNIESGGFYTDPQGNDLGKGKVVFSLSRAF
jgi:uncharacterized protein (TIGR02001 family)